LNDGALATLVILLGLFPRRFIVLGISRNEKLELTARSGRFLVSVLFATVGALLSLLLSSLSLLLFLRRRRILESLVEISPNI
jgi:hypothetical protein